jgi:hypothetical protein
MIVRWLSNVVFHDQGLPHRVPADSQKSPWHAIYQIRSTTPCRGQPVSLQKGRQRIHLALGLWSSGSYKLCT